MTDEREWFEVDPTKCPMCEESFPGEDELKAHMWTSCPEADYDAMQAGSQAAAAAMTSLLATCPTCGVGALELCVSGTLCEARIDLGLFAGITEAMYIEQLAKEGDES